MKNRIENSVFSPKDLTKWTGIFEPGYVVRFLNWVIFFCDPVCRTQTEPKNLLID